MTDNPHTYDDAAFMDASNDLQDAMVSLWEAGASEDDLKTEAENAIRNAVAS